MDTLITPSTSATFATSASLALIAILACVALLIQKEIAGSLDGERAQRLNRAISIALLPLLIIVVSVVVLRLITVLR